jgi:hypothetical protein
VNFISAVFSLLISRYFKVQISRPYKSDGIAKILHTLNRDCLWTKSGFKTSFRITKICKNLLNLEVTSYFSTYEILHPKYDDVFTCCCRLIVIPLDSSDGYLFIPNCSVSVLFLQFDSGDIHFPLKRHKCLAQTHQLT